MSWKPILRGSFLGFGLGVLPGGNPVTASFVSYALERRLARDPSRFGKGAIEGVAGPGVGEQLRGRWGHDPAIVARPPQQCRDRAAARCACDPEHHAGPLLAAQRPDVFWGVIASMYVGNVMLLILNLPLIGLFGFSSCACPTVFCSHSFCYCP